MSSFFKSETACQYYCRPLFEWRHRLPGKVALEIAGGFKIF